MPDIVSYLSAMDYGLQVAVTVQTMYATYRRGAEGPKTTEGKKQNEQCAKKKPEEPQAGGRHKASERIAKERETAAEQIQKEREAAGAQLQKEREAAGEQLQKERETARENIQKEQQACREEIDRIKKEAQELIQGKEAEANEKLRRKLSELKAMEEELRQSVLEANVPKNQDTPLTGSAPEKPKTGEGAQQSPEKPASRSSVPIPRFCDQYWFKKGCTKQACQELHLCRLFLAGICKFGGKCRNGHSLDSMHNKMVCTKKGFPMTPEAVHELQQLFAEKRLAPEAFYRRHLELCFKENSADSCHNCNRIHICRWYVEGTCTRQSNCKFGHNLHSPHNSAVLHLHKSSSMGDDDIVRLLYENSFTKGPIKSDQRGQSGVPYTAGCGTPSLLGTLAGTKPRLVSARSRACSPGAGRGHGPARKRPGQVTGLSARGRNRSRACPPGAVIGHGPVRQGP